MDHTLLTTKGVNRRSSQIQIVEAVRECVKSALKEFALTGFLGNQKPGDVKTAYQIALEIAVSDARRQAGSKVPSFGGSEHGLGGPKAPRFLHDSEFKRQVEESEDRASWNIGDPKELLQEVADEIAQEQAEEKGEAGKATLGDTEDPELAGLERILAETEAEANAGQVKPGSGSDIKVVDPTRNEDGSMSASEKIRLGLKDRKKYGEPPPEDRAKARLEALRAKAPEDLTPGENIELGAAEAEWRKGKNPRSGGED